MRYTIKQKDAKRGYALWVWVRRRYGIVVYSCSIVRKNRFALVLSVLPPLFSLICVYFFESGLFNGLRAIQKKIFSNFLGGFNSRCRLHAIA
jgi:hypothetical protein